MLLGWRTWYDDGTVYSSKDYEWKDIPDDGVLVRMLYFEGGGKEIQQGMNFYYIAKHHSGEEIVGCGMDSDEIHKRYQDPIIKRGRWAPTIYYRKIVDDAITSDW